MSAEFPIRLTQEAADRLARLLAKDVREGVFVRIGVKGGGCSGMEYLLRLDTRPIEGDLADEQLGIPLRCDPKSARYLRGSTLTYTGNLIGGGFRFDNPNAARRCGCGTSFTPKREAGA
ncbi:MAG: iron-sulfur cluster assembly accessory protein [Fimbriimonadales bacterium]|nr:iron-sulfur cluster assembly accessory protein [Fimbriimonadales bacterium]